MFVSGQDKASKDTFFLFLMIFCDNLVLKISYLKEKNVTQGVGVRKAPKKCHVLFKWLLISDGL
jgi:hypothetical protein